MATRRSRLIKKIQYVDPRGYEYYDVDIDVLVPDPENPRMPPQEASNLEVMLALYRRNPKSLYKLAEDLAKVGTNPAELLNVTRLSPNLFLVKEGNRRLTARKLLRNPEQLRDHVTTRELQKWQRLAKSASDHLTSRQVVVVGEDHNPWVTRRHQGYQDGVGVEQWGPDAKARHGQHQLGKRSRATALRDALRRTYPDRFPELPPKSFSIFERFVDSPEARLTLGFDVDEDGRLKLLRGERSLRMLEEIVRDIKRPRNDNKRLTTRTINDVNDQQTYLQKLEGRIDPESPPEKEITLDGEVGRKIQTSKKETSLAGSAARKKRAPDVVKSFTRPSSARLRKIFDELVKVRKSETANAAMVLVRVLLELSVDEYSQRVGRDFEAGDPELKQEIKELREFAGRNGYRIPRKLSTALNRAEAFTPGLKQKLQEVVDDLLKEGVLTRREAAAKKRELAQSDVVEILQDAVHRLENFPTIERVDNVLEIIRPVFNGIHR